MVVLGGLVSACGTAGSQDGAPSDGDAENLGDAAGPAMNAAPQCADYVATKRAYYGDLHTHTSYSLDAYTMATRTDPAGAYAFAALGASIQIASAAAGTKDAVGQTVNLGGKNLDFLAVTDHSEFLDADNGCTIDKNSGIYFSTYCRDYRDQGVAHQAAVMVASLAQLTKTNPNPAAVCQNMANGTAAQCSAEEQTAWQRTINAAEAANNPCKFSSLVAYEWTDTANGDNLHRNVVFNSNQVPKAPLDYLNYPSPNALWTGLSQQCTGACSAITIPHNSNASNGNMFVFADNDVSLMVKYQTLVEIHQHKGSSECLSDPQDGLNDQQCNFELLSGDMPNSADYAKNFARDKPGYVRSGLETGISYQASHAGSANPLKLGIVGATDNHNATPGYVVENNWGGHLGTSDDTPELRVQAYSNNCTPGAPGCTANANTAFNPGGITGVWAEQNTRDAIFSALQRREVFGTSGPRIQVRLYEYEGALDACAAGGNFPSNVLAAGGIPMGGTMPPGASAPKFVVSALKDTQDLAEVDIFKAAIVNGQLVEQLVRLPVSGGSACVTWTDPAFKPGAQAFYYARVLEQPTDRWSVRDCNTIKAKYPSTWQTQYPGCASTDTVNGGLNGKIQERAWTSPIWTVQ
jgi:hypothetical protein